MRLAAVILNYNDALETLEAVRMAAGVSEIGAVVVVDNASTDDSIDVLKDGMEWLKKDGLLGKDAGKLSALIRTRRNGGYGSGNNIGVRYAAEHFKARYCLIANPDSVYPMDLITRMLGVFEKSQGDTFRGGAKTALVGAVGISDPGAVLVGTVASDSTGVISYDDFISSGWKKRNLAEEIIYSAPVLKRVFKKAVNYPESYYRNTRKSVTPVYAVRGSLMMADTARFLEAGGFDEEFFLYMEESALAKRLEWMGFRTYLLNRPYVHGGSHSISGAGCGIIKRQRMRQRSERLYYSKYLGAGLCSMCVVRLIQAVVLTETAAYAVLKEAFGKPESDDSVY